MKKLNVENPFFEFMGSIGDVMLVNLLFLVFSIPVVTIGASYAAMYETQQSWYSKEEGVEA